MNYNAIYNKDKTESQETQGNSNCLNNVNNDLLTSILRRCLTVFPSRLAIVQLVQHKH